MNQPRATSERLLRNGVAASAAHPGATLVTLALLTVLCLWFSASRFAINADMGDLIRQQADWRDDYNAYKDHFPVLYKTALVVVSGTSMDAVEQTTARLAEGLRAHHGLDAIFAPLADSFLRDNALLFLTEEELEQLADRLAAAQPVLTAIAEEPGLTNILDVLRRGIEEDGDAELEQLLLPLTESAEAIAAGTEGRVSWRDRLLDADDEATHYSVISLTGRANRDAAQPNSEIMAQLREVIASTAPDPGVQVRISGEIALSHEEITAAQQGVQLAGLVSLLLLSLILAWGVRSLKIIAATLLMLATGVIWTSAWGLLAVGQFNALSLIFAVIFFGLGVDFAIHYSLRYQEALYQGRGNTEALTDAAASVGPSILLCTVTTAVGFLAFVPTDYQGLSELGIIAAGGMVVAALLIFTLLPAFYALTGPPRAVTPELRHGVELVRRLLRRRHAVLLVTGLVTLGALLLARQIHFDYSVLALRDPTAESMTTLRELQREGVVNEYAISVLTPDRNTITALQTALEALPTVASVESPLDYLPDNQDAKLLVLEDIRFMLWSALEPIPGDSTEPGDLERAVTALQATIAQEAVTATATEALLHRLGAAMSSLQAQGDQALEQWEQAATGQLPGELQWLRRALNARPFSFEDLPADLRSRLVSPGGQYRLAVLPAEDISTIESLSRFVESVCGVAPTATGRPVVEWGLGSVVSNAFKQALALAFLVVGLVLLLVLRSLRDTLLVLTPLVLAALFTLAIQVLIGMPLNMANILVLPLIFGLGVDNGIHVVHRFRRDGSVDSLMHSSTPRAVILSTLTTIGTFAALSLSPHQGTASIGLLLTFAVGFLLVLVLCLLPVLLAQFGSRSAGQTPPVAEPRPG